MGDAVGTGAGPVEGEILQRDLLRMQPAELPWGSDLLQELSLPTLIMPKAGVPSPAGLVDQQPGLAVGSLHPRRAGCPGSVTRNCLGQSRLGWHQAPHKELDVHERGN